MKEVTSILGAELPGRGVGKSFLEVPNDPLRMKGSLAKIDESVKEEFVAFFHQIFRDEPRNGNATTGGRYHDGGQNKLLFDDIVGTIDHEIVVTKAFKEFQLFGSG